MSGNPDVFKLELKVRFCFRFSLSPAFAEHAMLLHIIVFSADDFVVPAEMQQKASRHTDVCGVAACFY